jgi:hypothetical protein
VVVVEMRTRRTESTGFRFVSGLHPWQLTAAESNAMLRAILGALPPARNHQHQPLMQIVVDLVSFLAQSDHDTVDRDTAVEQLEHVAAMLQQLPAAEKEEFLAYVEQAASSTTDSERSALLRSLPEQLGLVASPR